MDRNQVGGLMDLENSFVVGRGVDETWEVLNDLEFITPCMPGAKLLSAEDDSYTGSIKVKVGPIVATYTGSATFVERDAATHRARIEASGRDPRQGNASAVVTATLHGIDASTTRVDLATSVSLSGKFASFGKGAIEDISRGVLDEFSANLEAALATGGGDVPPDAAAAGAVEGPRGGSASPEPAPLDLLAVAGGSLGKRIAPIAVAVGVLIVVIWLVRRLSR